MEANKNTSKVLYIFFLAFSLALIAAGFLTATEPFHLISAKAGAEDN